jgi:hypothetical protein
MQVLPPEQSDFVEHSFTGPGAVPGAEQRPLWQVSPFGHVESSAHWVVHPLAVQMDPAGQDALPVQLGWLGAETFEHP